ncbi:MAG: exodeoxyribonuclease VII large subunit [Acidaminococcaceae bacterium]|nr:exodeoxyribonuclease VII large subunit [Acidaminococcaceae bacterium]
MAEARTYTVSEMNRLIKNLVEGSGVVTNVQVRGEISNFKRYPSGHCYFSLKDKNGVLKCVMFRRQAVHLIKYPNNGDTVVAVGSIGVYERDGVYQLYADLLIAEGAGDLMQAYEKLKNKLAAEGLFAEERKKPLPVHPRTVGIITSPAGAAVRDVISVSRRRDPGIRLLLYPVQVQGKAAAAEIAQAIRFMNRHRLADVLIVGRGGGSMEDLWAFNEEAVVRAIAASEIPLISSVGHETDFTLADFAADRRAATPSQAAELAVADTGQYKRQVERNRQRLESALTRILREKAAAYQRLAASRVLRDPLRITDRAEERLDRALMKLRQSLPQRVQNRELRLQQAMKALQHPERVLLEPERRLQAVRKILSRQPEKLIGRAEQKMALLTARLDAVSPLKVLGRGYSVTLDERGQLLKSVDSVHWGEEIHTRLQDGNIYSVVQQVERREDDGR